MIGRIPAVDTGQPDASTNVAARQRTNNAVPDLDTVGALMIIGYILFSSM